MALRQGIETFSQFLRVAFLRSPNYVAGSAGWTINQDGSAEFNNLTIRGTFKGTDFIINSAGIFLYSGTPALGNLVASLTSASGTDSFGNAYAAGIALYDSSGNARLVEMFSANPNFEMLNASGAQIGNMSTLKDALLWYADTGSAAQGAIVASIAGKSGTDVFGNAFPQGVKIFQGEFDGTNFVINSSGAFFYSGTPATGNLIASIAPAAGTDAHSNAYVAGFGSYANSGSTLTQIDGDTVGIGLASANALALFELFSELAMDGITITSGRALSGTTQAWIALLNSAYTSPNGSTPAIIVGQGPSGAGNTDTFSNHLFQVRGSQTTDTVFAWHPGSSRQTEETWQSLGTLAGATVNKGRYRLLPDGEVKVEIDITFAVATAVPITFANTLPSGYQAPGSVDVRAPMAQTNSSGGIGRIFIGSAGGSSPGQVQFTTLGGGTAIGTYSAYFSYSIL